MSTIIGNKDQRKMGGVSASNLQTGAATLEGLSDIDHSTETSGYVLSVTPSGGKTFSWVAAASGGGGGGGGGSAGGYGLAIPPVQTAFASATNNANGTQSSLTVTFPSTATSGNTLLLFITRGSESSATVTTPTGWTLVQDNPNPTGGSVGCTIFKKSAAGTETSVTVAFSNADYHTVLFYELPGARTVTIVGSTTAAFNSDWHVSIPGFTPGASSMPFVLAGFVQATSSSQSTIVASNCPYAPLVAANVNGYGRAALLFLGGQLNTGTAVPSFWMTFTQVLYSVTSLPIIYGYIT